MLYYTLVLLLPTLTLAANLIKPDIYKLQGSCKSHHWPTETTYIPSYNNFCDTFVSANLISSKAPLMATYELRDADDKKLSWVYEIICQYPNDGPWEALCAMTKENCKLRFSQFLEDEGIGGGLGGKKGGYCVVDGTGGDAFNGQGGVKGMSGEGKVLVWGGQIDEADFREGGHGTVQRAIFKARRKGENNGP